MFYPTERRIVAQALPLTLSSINRFSNIFPLDGTGWTKLILAFHASWTTAMTAPTLGGVYQFIKGIKLTTSRGEVIVDNVPGQAMQITNAIFDHKPPYYNSGLLSASLIADAVLEIPFTMAFLNRPEDTIFDSGRYSNLQLDITTGTLADIGATSTALVCTMDIHVENTLSALSPDGKSKPYAHAYYRSYGPLLNSAQNFYDLESSLDLGLFGFFVKVGATGTMACQFEGPGLDDLTSVTFRDSVRRWVDGCLDHTMRNERNQFIYFDSNNVYKVTPATPTATLYPFIGVYPHSFVQFGSINEHYATGKKSLIRVECPTTTATSRTSLMTWGMRALR
jgi:hypothetical protein